MRSLVLMIFVSVLCGCTATKTIFAMNSDTDDFKILEQDTRVKYQSGSETNAQIVVASLGESIKTVEERQGAFVKPITVYLPSSVGNYAKYCASKNSGGCVLNERLFISPKEENTEERIPKVLAHELSHLQMEQAIGTWKHHSNIPSWFMEGLAVYASKGAGAENISVEEAQRAIITGHSFVPNKDGSLLFPKTASYFGLETHMFYQQAGIFVAWLHDQSDENFKKLLTGIQSGEKLEESMIKAYGFGVSENWSRFERSIKA